MAMKSGFLLLLFLASASLSLAFSDPQQKLDQCLQVCQSRYPGPQVTLTCMSRCANDYYKQIKPQFQNQLEEDQDFSSPVLQQQQEEFDCKRQCQFEPRSRQRKCQMKCEQGEQDEGFSPRPSRLDRLRSCQKRCSELGFLQQLPCQTRCATEFGFRGDGDDNAIMNPEESEDTSSSSPQKESEETSGKELEETSSSKPSRFPQPQREREVEQCQRRCQFQPKWQQGQCFRRCESGQGQQKPQSKWDRYEQCQRRCAQMGPFSQIPCHAKCTADFGFGIAGLSDF